VATAEILVQGQQEPAARQAVCAAAGQSCCYAAAGCNVLLCGVAARCNNADKKLQSVTLTASTHLFCIVDVLVHYVRSAARLLSVATAG
jgi:hypothetical protein